MSVQEDIREAIRKQNEELREEKKELLESITQTTKELLERFNEEELSAVSMLLIKVMKEKQAYAALSLLGRYCILTLEGELKEDKRRCKELGK